MSHMVRIDHTAPVVGDLKTMVKGTSVTIALRAVDRTGLVAALDYSVDAPDHWQRQLPNDKIADSPEERFTIALADLPPGSHAVSIRVTDLAGNEAFESVTLTVPGGAQ